MRETWKDYPDFPCYQCSTLGRVRNKITERIIVGSLTKKGYRKLTLQQNGEKCYRSVHCMIARTFKGIRPPGLDVNHKDGYKENNVPGNLEYVTHKTNMQHAVTIGLIKTGPAHPLHGIRQNYKRRLTTEQISLIQKLHPAQTQQALAIKFGVAQVTISRAVRGVYL